MRCHCAGLRRRAVLPQVAEQFEVPFDAALDAVLVEAEELEVPGLGEPGAGLGEGIVDFAVAGEVGVEGQGKDGAFDGGGAFEAPPVVGDGLREIRLQRADGLEGLMNAAAVLVIGGLVGGGEDVDLACKFLAKGVEGS